MIDTLAIKKYSLRYWVDRSQAARKAAEELAMKEVKPSLRDKYKPEGLVFDLDGKMLEFKGEYEKKADGDIYFTYDEAMERFGEPNKDGWRLPTKEELGALRDNYPYEFDKENKQGIFDRRLYLPATGYRKILGGVDYVGFEGDYWSFTPYGSYEAWALTFYLGGAYLQHYPRQNGFSVRLVRDAK